MVNPHVPPGLGQERGLPGTEESTDSSWSLARVPGGLGAAPHPRQPAAPPTAPLQPEGFILSSYPRLVAPAAPGLGLPLLLQATTVTAAYRAFTGQTKAKTMCRFWETLQAGQV